MDDLIARLERIRDKYNMMYDEYDCITSAAAQIHTARDGLTEVYLSGFYDGAAKERAARDAALAEGVALGIEAAAVAFEIPLGEQWDDCCIDSLYDQECAIRNLDPAAIIAARERSNYAPVGDSDGDDGA